MRIYIASPYGRRRGNNEAECEANVAVAVNCARELIKRGHNPYVPHLWHWIHKGWFATLNEEEYLNLCKAWVPCCDAVLRLAGESEGADAEVALAKELGIPVYYSVDNMPK